MTRDRGSAVVEFVVLGVCLLVPLVYVITAIATVQSAMFASTQAVREAGRAFSMAPTERSGRSAALAAARLAFADHGIDVPADALTVVCSDGPCLSPGSAVRVELEWTVPLPWLPDVMASGAAIPISATHRVPIDEYRSGPGD